MNQFGKSLQKGPRYCIGSMMAWEEFMASEFQIEFCHPEYGDSELEALTEALRIGKLEGGGVFNQRCQALIRDRLSAQSALMTPSCTASLEMMALALDLKPGDEVIMPDFTFVSTANAFALRGATPVFVDIDADTLNIDPSCAAKAVTKNTKAIVAVHYAGVACDMTALKSICDDHDLALLEDAAQAYGASYYDKPLGSIGMMSAFSFHHTKNFSCGEGGAIVCNDPENVLPLELIQEKGTDRASFKRRETNKYEWSCLGSSYLLSELSAAVLSIQLNRADEINAKRLQIWERYESGLQPLSALILPKIPDYATHNSHIFHVRLPSRTLREALIADIRSKGIVVSSHYVPLHLTKGGNRFARAGGPLDATITASETLVRLPVHTKMSVQQVDQVVTEITDFCTRHGLA